MKVAVAELLPRVTFDTSRNKNATMLDWLAKSIGEIGLQHPIGVYHDADGVLQVVAGRHRVLAYAQLGKTEPTKYAEIEAVLLDDLSPLDRELWTIDENLRRADLDSFERDKQTALRVKLVDRQLKDTQVAPGKVPPPLTKKEIRQRYEARERGEKVPPTPRQAAGVPTGVAPKAVTVLSQQLGLHRSTVRRRVRKADPVERDRLSTLSRVNNAVSSVYHILTAYAEDWPEVKRRVEEKLGKTIVERIQELERGPAEVVGLRQA